MLTDVFDKPPMAYVSVWRPIGVIDFDSAPGSGGGGRAGIGFRADWYFVEAYAQQVWTGGGVGQQFTVSGALGIGF